MTSIATKDGAVVFFAHIELSGIIAKLSPAMRKALLGDPYPAPVTAHALARRGLLAEGWRSARGGRGLPLSDRGEAVAAFLQEQEQTDG